MKFKVICFLSLLFILLGDRGFADDTQELVQAQIGIKLRTGDEIRRAKSIERRVKAGDGIQIYVRPEFEEAYIYVIYSNQNTMLLLNEGQIRSMDRFVLQLPLQEIPDDELFYEFDGESPKEYVTIICSPVELPEVTQLFEIQDVTYDRWLELEGELIEESRIELDNIVEKPLSIAGGLRGGDPFLKELQLFSGKSFVVKKYEFGVKK